MKKVIITTSCILFFLLFTINESEACSVRPVAILDTYSEYGWINTVVIFDGSRSYTYYGSITKYEWDWDNDGNYDYEEIPGAGGDGIAEYTFASAGDYTVTLRVTNSKGYSDTDSCTVHVIDPASADHFYVAEEGDDSSNDGLSWNEPFATIQHAIDTIEADSGIQIAITEVDTGTYNENITFGGKIILLTSTDPDNSSVVENTKVSGTGTGSVVTFHGDEGPSCILTGFTIEGGNDTIGRGGGGINGNCITHATISKCIIRNNTTISHGGGVADCYGLISECWIYGNSSSSASGAGGGLGQCCGTIDRCRITENSAVYGGGISLCPGIISNCVIAENISSNAGGGIDNCDGQIINCTITNNSVSNTTNGALSDCDGMVRNCIIWGNTGTGSASIDVLYDSDAWPYYSCVDGYELNCNDLVSYWKFDEGDGEDSGDNNNDLTLTNTTAVSGGKVDGALEFNGSDSYAEISSPANLNVTHITMAAWVKADTVTLSNDMFILNREMTYPGTYTLFFDNDSDKWAARIRISGRLTESDIIYSDSAATTDWTHVAATYDGYYFKLYINGELQNDTKQIYGTIDTTNPSTLFVGDNPDHNGVFDGLIDEVAIYDEALSSDEVFQLYFNGSDGHEYRFTGNIYDDPEFVDPDHATDPNYHLRPETACLDAGDPGGDYTGQTDLDGKPRVCNDVVDMGAYEKAIIYVDDDAAGDNNGTSWANAYLDLQDALAAAAGSPADEIRVATGTYKPGSLSDDTFQLINGLAMYGGFPNGGGSWSERNPDTYISTLSGDIGATHSSKIVTAKNVGASTILDGFEITSSASYGILCEEYASPTIINCDINNNGTNGVNVWYNECSPTISNCKITSSGPGSNSANIVIQTSDCLAIINDCFIDGCDSSNAGVYVVNGSAQITGCTIKRCTNGIHVYNESGDAQISDCSIETCTTGITIYKGLAHVSGGTTIKGCTSYGICCYGNTGRMEVSNSIIFDNRHGIYIPHTDASATITNCTIVENTDHGIYANVSNPENRVIQNCIIWGNTNDDLNDYTITYSFMEAYDPGSSFGLGLGNFGGSGLDPKFADAPNDNYHLAVDSLCIDAGTPWSDYSNEPSGGSGRVNLGAYGNTDVATAATDTDGDRLSDYWEIHYFGDLDEDDTSNSEQPVPDNFTNWAEYLFGYDPTATTNADLIIPYYTVSPTTFDPTAASGDNKTEIEIWTNMNSNAVITFTNNTTTEPVMVINETASEGQNTYFWDGKDESSLIVEKAYYYTASVVVSASGYDPCYCTPADDIEITYPHEINNLVSLPLRLIATNNEISTIGFDLGAEAPVTITIRDPSEGIFTTLTDNPSHEIEWNGRNADGEYISEQGSYTITVQYDGMRESAATNIKVYR